MTTKLRILHGVGVRVGVMLLVVAISGCGGEKKVQTAPVSGTVMFKGKPLVGGGMITFVPENGKEATGDIAKDGTFKLRTYEEGDGAPLGEFRVEIEQNQVLQEAEYPEQAGDSEEEETAEVKPTKPRILVPEKDLISEAYASDKSPIRLTVKEGDNNFKIELKVDPGVNLDD